MAIASPRPDFDAALLEFLIGLMTVAMDVDDEDGWFEWWQKPPTPDQLRERLISLPDAFYLDGDGPRFLQDLDSAAFDGAEPFRIEQLLIDSPGDQTLRHNSDLFVKRDRIMCLGRPGAAMALLTLQMYAPAGGQGHRTSIRGGGPLTTLGVLRRRAAVNPTLWEVVWPNAETRSQWSARVVRLREDTPPGRFAWLAATRVSDKESGATTTPADAHPLQCYFSMPRRIRLEFGGPGTCGLTGASDDVTVVGFKMRNFGVNYEGWRHPLSAYYRVKPGSELLPVHRQVNGLVWRDWLGLTLGTPDGLREPAGAISHLFRERLALMGHGDFSIAARGFDMDNMKARGWVEAIVPAFQLVDDGARERARDAAARLAEGTAAVEIAMLRAVEGALYERVDDAKGDRSHLKADLWNATEAAFFAVLARVASGMSDETLDDAISEYRRDVLEPAALSAFDRATDQLGSDPIALRRVVRSRYGLHATVRGFGKEGTKVFKHLRLPVPTAAKPPKQRKERTK